MKNKIPTWAIVVGVIVLAFMYLGGTYNTLVSKGEGVASSWGQVSNVYQRRLDLIPNLVETVKGYAKHEEETLTAVIEARSKATQTTIDPSNISPEALAKFEQAQGGINSALSRLMVVAEKYPDLKANENFLNLQTQLEGTENRITNERRTFNESVKDYNSYAKAFPQNILANLFGFKAKAYFEAEPAAAKAPEVKF
ncbi:MAG: LemA family protein [Candidatus Caenarcaniphilales bacterium]|jgi:LemA protein|nr:LemA family protein [Candidatus Caenarcaniphilales bacterium]